MALDAGAVYATLGGRFNPAAFRQFDSAMKQSAENMTTAEGRMRAAQARSSASLHAMGKAAKIGAGLGIAGLTVAIGASIKKAAEFEQQMSALGAVSDATGAQMGRLKKQAMEAGAATKYSALEAAQAQTELAKGGLKVQEILGGGLKAALGLAAAGELDLADAAKYTVNAMKLFHIDGGKAISVADALATAANTTTADVQDFGMALTQGGSMAKQAGLSFNDTVTVLEALAEIGVKNSDAGTSMKAAFGQLLHPTKQQAAAAKEAGLNFETANGEMKDGVQISAMLRDQFKDLTDVQRVNMFQTLAGQDGFRTLAALYDAGPAKLRKLAAANLEQGTAAETAAKKQDNLKGRIENLGGSIETASIQLGQIFIPQLTKGAEKATDFINQLSSSGKLDDFGRGVIEGGQDAIGVLHALVVAGAPVASLMLHIGQAMNLGDPGTIVALATGFAAFKVAGVVAPMVMALGGAISNVVTMARAGYGVAEMASEVGLLANPFTAAAVAAGALAAAIVYLSTRESAEEAAAKRVAAAKRDQAAALKELFDAEQLEVQTGLDVDRSKLGVERAQKNLNQLRKEGKKGTLEYREAELDLADAKNRLGAAERKLATDQAATRKGQDRDRKVANDRLADAKKEFDQANQDYQDATAGGAKAPDYIQKRRLAAQLELNNATKAFGQIQRVASLSDVTKKRISAGLGTDAQIKPQNAANVQFAGSVLASLPKNVHTKVSITGDQDVLSTIGDLSAKLIGLGKQKTVTKVLASAESATSAMLAFRALVAGVPARKVSKILASTSGADEVARLKAAIAALKDKTVSVNVRQYGTLTDHGTVGAQNRHASGRGPGGRELGLVGEGRDPREWYVDPAKGTAMKITGPMLMPISDTASIIPMDPAYRGRALGFLKDIAEDMGVQMYKTGKKPKKSRPIPKRSQWITQDPDELGQEISALKGKENDKDKKGHLSSIAKSARARLAKLKPVYEFVRGKNRAIQKDQENAENWRSEMELADKLDDQKSYDTAKREYQAALERERIKVKAVYDALLKVNRGDTKYGRQIRGKLLEVQGYAADAAASVLTPNDGAATGGTDPDTQAQIDQRVERAYQAGRGDLSRLGLAAVLGGAGDIGTGAQTVRDLLAGGGQPQVVQNINTLYPADPQTLRAIGDAASAGFTLQPSRVASKQRLGI